MASYAAPRRVDQIGRESLRLREVRKVLVTRGEADLADRLLRSMTAEEAREFGNELGGLGAEWYVRDPDPEDTRPDGLSLEEAGDLLRWVGRWYTIVGAQDFGVEVEA